MGRKVGEVSRLLKDLNKFKVKIFYRYFTLKGKEKFPGKSAGYRQILQLRSDGKESINNHEDNNTIFANLVEVLEETLDEGVDDNDEASAGLQLDKTHV